MDPRAAPGEAARRATFGIAAIAAIAAIAVIATIAIAAARR
jgi:hypothetical protein